MTVREFLEEILQGAQAFVAVLGEVFIFLLTYVFGVLGVVFWPFSILDSELAHALGALSVYGAALTVLLAVFEAEHAEETLSQRVAISVFIVCGIFSLTLMFLDLLQALNLVSESPAG